MIIKKPNPNLKLQRPSVIIDTVLDPKPKQPLPAKNGFCVNIVEPAGSGKTSVMLSMVKSKDGYRKRFHKIIAVIPSSSLNSLKSNPLDDLPDDQRFEELTYETLEDVIDMVGKKRRRIINIITIR